MLKLKKFISLFFVLCLSGCATLPTETIATFNEIHLKNLCSQYNVVWYVDSVTHVVSLSYNDSEANVLIGSNVVLIDGQKVVLSTPVRTVRSSVIVPADFKSKVINRLIKEQPAAKVAFRTRTVREIVIDAGHGGKDPGATGKTGLKEKEVVLDIAKDVNRILKQKGLKVKMTRTTDKFISLKERTEIASQSKADLFVSIHANAHKMRGVHGVEVYSSPDLNYIEKNEAVRKTNHKNYFKVLDMKRNDRNLEDIVADMLYTHKQAESKKLAGDVSRKIARSIRAKNLGEKKARFYVLRNTLTPAVLVEVGYLSNPKEERLLRQKSYRKKIARALANSILDYANIKRQ